MTLQASDFKVGDKVTVAADARTTGGGGVYFGKQINGVVSAFLSPEGNVPVVNEIGMRQHVAPQYLTRRFDVGDKVLVAEDAESPFGEWSSLHGSGLKGNVGTVTSDAGEWGDAMGVNCNYVFTKYLTPVRDEEEPVDDCPFLSLQGECCGRPSECAPEQDHYEETGCDCEMDEDDELGDGDLIATQPTVARNTLLSAFATAHDFLGNPEDLISLEDLLVEFLVALDIEVTD